MDNKNLTKKILMLGTVVTALTLSGCGPKTPPEPSLEEKIIQRAQEEVRLNLKDPDSAQFRNVVLKEDTTKPEDIDEDIGVQPKVCGEVNAKNSMGGYVGFKPFYAYVRIKNNEIIIDAVDIDGNRFYRGFEEHCLGIK